MYQSEHSALNHDSYIDLSGAKTFSPNEIAGAKDRGPLPYAVIDRIRLRLVAGVKTLPAKHRQLALANLS